MRIENIVVDGKTYRVQIRADALSGGYDAICQLREGAEPIELSASSEDMALERMRRAIERTRLT